MTYFEYSVKYYHINKKIINAAFGQGFFTYEGWNHLNKRRPSLTILYKLDTNQRLLEGADPEYLLRMKDVNLINVLKR